MLETLDTIDWSHLQTCYGHPEEIPRALRNIASSNAAVRGEAFGTLHIELTHQGTIYEASISVIPFLFELLAVPLVQDKCLLVGLLADLSSKGAYLGEIFQDLATRRFLKDRVEGPLRFPASRRDDEMVDERAHQAVREGFPQILPLLANDDPIMRMEVAYLLTFFPEDASELTSLVVAQLQKEQDEGVISCLLLCLGHLLSALPEAIALLMHYLHNKTSNLLQMVAAMALSRILQEKVPEMVIHVLFALLVDPPSLHPAYETLPREWGHPWVPAEALLHLDQLTDSPHQALIMERLLEASPLLDEFVARDCTDRLLRVAFYKKGFAFHHKISGTIEAFIPPPFGELDSLQQRILQLFVATETLWVEPSWKPFFRSQHPIRLNALAHLRLPSTLQDLQAYIASNKHD